MHKAIWMAAQKTISVEKLYRILTAEKKGESGKKLLRPPLGKRIHFAISGKSRGWVHWFPALAVLLMSPQAMSFTVNTSSSEMMGLWWNPNEGGWGAALTHQYDVIFVTMYAYDGSGNPVWYVASNCAVAANGCTGDLYKVTGGSAPTQTWNGANLAVNKVGVITLAFTDNSNGSMTYTINGANGFKAITRQVFRTAPPVSTTNTISHGGLTWTVGNGTYRWAQADAYCANSSINGQTGWRLPTQPELSSYAQSGKDVRGGGVWSSTPTLTPTYHYYVSLNGTTGTAYESADSSYRYVRCVR